MTGGTQKTEPEITSPVDLCLNDGTLNPAAVGWTRRPIHRANLKGWGRNKRFEYWCITTPEIVIALNVSHSDYRVTIAAFFLDRAKLTGFPEAEIHWLPPRGRVDSMPERSGAGPVVGRGDRMLIEMLPEAGRTILRGRTDRLQVELEVTEAPDHQCMCVVVPWDSQRFQYTRKDNCMPVRGRVVADGKTYEVREETAYATLDHGRGRWPYSIIWNWASGSGRSDGHELGLQFGAKWTDGTPSTENSLRVDGQVEKISQELTWTYDRSNWMGPWGIHGNQVDLVFTPQYDRVGDFDRIVVISKEHQVFGMFDGSIVTSAGKRIQVNQIFGWAEEVHRRW